MFISGNIRLSLIGCLIYCIFATGCAAPKATYTKYTRADYAISESPSILINTSDSEPVTFRGLMNFDNVSAGQAQMLYPGDTAGLFLASVMVHGLMVESVKNAQKQAIEEESNAIIEPYRPVTGLYKNGELVDASYAALAEQSYSTFSPYTETAEPTSLVVDIKPIFYITADEKTIILKNIISLWEKSEKPLVVYENLIEVQEDLVTDDFPREYYLDNDGEYLKGLTSDLFVQSMHHFLVHLKGGYVADDADQVTIKFLQNGNKTFERASILDIDCGRATFLTLRGWIKSVRIDPSDFSERAELETCFNTF